MITFNKIIVLIVVQMSLTEFVRSVVFTDFPQIRMGQSSIFDNVYFALGKTSSVDITYKTQLSSAAIDYKTAVFSGFQNYLHDQIHFSISVVSASISNISLNIFVGSRTYIKQLNINYFVMQSSTKSPFVFVSVGNYRTLMLDDQNDPNYGSLRMQYFNNETTNTSFLKIRALCSAIQGIQYENTEGALNQVSVKTSFVQGVGSTPGVIEHKIYVAQKGKLFYISISSILLRFDFTTNSPYLSPTGYSFDTKITSTTGFTQLNTIFEPTPNGGGLLDQTSNSIFFGIKGFKFSMESTRLFLLNINTILDLRNSLSTNNFMIYTELSFLLIFNQNCGTDYYYIEGFKCKLAADCTTEKLFKSSSENYCQACASLCDGCSATNLDCNLCKDTVTRVIGPSSPTSPSCICKTGYFEVIGQQKCELCSNFIPGCLACSSADVCTDCGNPGQFKIKTVGTKKICVCLNDAQYLVSGICLSFPGCLIADTYITGKFCLECDNSSNFVINLADFSKCVCKTAYDNTWNGNLSLCQDKCGDSKTPASPANATDLEIICDDGNEVNGDGCSSKCRQQFGYFCVVETPGQISKCSEKQQIKITYLYSEKKLNGNQGVIAFSLLPKQSQLAQNAFQNSILTNVPGKKKITFDSVNSLIKIAVDYSDTLQTNQYQFNFTFKGMTIYSSDINLKVSLYGTNAKLQISDKPYQINIVTYLALAVSAFALVLGLIASFLGQKLIGIELILPIQATFFSMVTLPKNVLAPISALWSLKYSNGYNSLAQFDLSTNYMLDSRVTMMQYSGQYILNYNIMFLLIVFSIVIIGILSLRQAYLGRQERRLEDLQNAIEQKLNQKKELNIQNAIEQKLNQKKGLNNNQNLNKDEKEEKQTEGESNKRDQLNMVEQQLEETGQSIKYYKNFINMIFDRFFSTLIITSMMKVIFCFYIQLSNLTYSTEVYDNSLNASFFLLTYATIITGLYLIIYDYKTDKLILFNCNKGKYAIFYISIFLGYIVVLGSIFQTFLAVYVAAIFAILPIILIIYQLPYGLKRFDFQAIIAIICQLPFVVFVVVSLTLNLQITVIKESIGLIFAYAIIGSIGLSIILTAIRLIKIIDRKNASCFQFANWKKQNSNSKKMKKNKIVLLEIQMEKDWDQEGSVRSVLQDRKKKQVNDKSNNENQVKPQKIQEEKPKEANKNDSKSKLKEDEEDDEEIEEIQKIKMKLRKQLKQKKNLGKIK